MDPIIFLAHVAKTGTSMNKNELNDHMFRQDMEVWIANYICRDFTKRQLKILGLLYILGMETKSLECYIPTLSSFEILGVNRTKIRKEIEKLESAKVMFWNRDKMTFRINPDTDQWKIPMNEKHTSDRIQRLIDLNRSR